MIVSDVARRPLFPIRRIHGIRARVSGAARHVKTPQLMLCTRSFIYRTRLRQFLTFIARFTVAFYSRLGLAIVPLAPSKFFDVCVKRRKIFSTAALIFICKKCKYAMYMTICISCTLWCLMHLYRKIYDYSSK